MNYIRFCANESCGERFKTEYENKKYCSYQCKMSEEHRRYRHRYNDKIKAYMAEPKRKEYMKKYRRGWARDHKEEIRENARQNYEKNREMLVKRAREYRSLNKDKLRVYWRNRYYQKLIGGKNMKLEIRKCPQCGKEYYKMHWKQKFCGKKCRSAFEDANKGRFGTKTSPDKKKLNKVIREYNKLGAAIKDYIKTQG